MKTAFAGKSLFLLLAITGALAAQSSRTQLRGYTVAIPWDRSGAVPSSGITAPAAVPFASAVPFGSVPMFSVSLMNIPYLARGGKGGFGVMVGTNPAGTLPYKPSNIPTVVIPLRVTIGASVFDPAAPNPCDGNISAVDRFNGSPLVQPAPMVFNGVNVGTTQYVDGFRRAEFWRMLQNVDRWTYQPSSPAYHNMLSPVFTAATVSISAGTNGITSGGGCSELGIVSYSWISNYLSNTLIPQLTSLGVIDPTKFAIFLVSNVAQSPVSPPSPIACCILGYHSAKGNPPQTYTIIDWGSTNQFGVGFQGDAIASHEIAEWMDDPLVTNVVAPWGRIGQVGGCPNPSFVEVGDPLSGTLMPAIAMNGKAYYMQELAFHDWFYSYGPQFPALGAGGKYSGNGTLSGPARDCPPGGTY
jgi:hypothetical protein